MTFVTLIFLPRTDLRLDDDDEKQTTHVDRLVESILSDVLFMYICFDLVDWCAHECHGRHEDSKRVNSQADDTDESQ